MLERWRGVSWLRLFTHRLLDHVIVVRNFTCIDGIDERPSAFMTLLRENLSFCKSYQQNWNFGDVHKRTFCAFTQILTFKTNAMSLSFFLFSTPWHQLWMSPFGNVSLLPRLTWTSFRNSCSSSKLSPTSVFILAKFIELFFWQLGQMYSSMNSASLCRIPTHFPWNQSWHLSQQM